MHGDLEITSLTRTGPGLVRVGISSGDSFLTDDLDVLNFERLSTHARGVARGSLAFKVDWESHVRDIFARGKATPAAPLPTAGEGPLATR